VAWAVCDRFVMTAFTTWLYLRKFVTGKGRWLRSLYARLYCGFLEDELSKEKYASGLLELGFPNFRKGNPLHMTLPKDDFDFNLTCSCLGNLRRTHEAPERVLGDLQPTIGQKANNA